MMDSSSNISTHQTLEGAMPEHMGDGRVSASVLEGKDRARTRLVDAETQTEANFFASTEVVRLISNSREELERRVRELERELNRIKQERDEAIVEAFDVSQNFRSSSLRLSDSSLCRHDAVLLCPKITKRYYQSIRRHPLNP